VPATVPLAPDQSTARLLLHRRPPTVARRLDLANELSSPRRARLLVTTACQDWRLDSVCDDAVIVASELVENAVVHARTRCRLAIRLDDRGLTIAVRDRGPFTVLHPRPGHGLFTVAEVSRAWDVSPTEEGRSVLDRIKVETELLSALNGDAFDKEYMTLVTNTQQSVIHFLERHKAAAKDQDVKQFLGDLTTTVQNRLKRAQDIMAKVYGDGI